MTEPKPPGRIVTFYSYKGGTGRSMAVANVAWILASTGLKVLVIDWDLEAPGLHRYFHPFIKDKEHTQSPGLIDFFVDFAAAARVSRSANGSPSDRPWYEDHTGLLRYAYSLDWPFARKGTVDFVPAGQQGPCYPINVASFNWQEFYGTLGGGVFLEAVKQELRASYHYILIDSRTGISDTSGICTVQMPDDLLICFTLNRQSIKGAAAVAESADTQRRRATGEPSLRVWPVAMRVELAEKERLEAARDLARATFEKYLRRLTRSDRASYWGRTEVLYQPYFAYEEVLACFADRRRQTTSLLTSMEALASCLTPEPVELSGMPERERQRGLALFVQTRPTTEGTTIAARTGTIYVSYSGEDAQAVAPVVHRLIDRFGDAVWWDQVRLLPGADWRSSIRRAFDAADVVLSCFGRGWNPDRKGTFRAEAGRIVGDSTERHVIPVLLEGLTVLEWGEKLFVAGLEQLANRHALSIGEHTFDEDVRRLIAGLEKVLSKPIDPDDPQKGRWGGAARRNGHVLAATVSEISKGWFEVTLTVKPTAGADLVGPVEFHLHPTFHEPVRIVEAANGIAELRLKAWGAFTLGVATDKGQTTLELDLSEDDSFPTLFRER